MNDERFPPYRFGLVWPSSHPKAPETAHLLGPRTLGIEVTDATLAAACGLGNLDPQHGEAPGTASAAIEAALFHPLPPDDAILVTIRPDADSLGAMAVLCLRRLGVPLTGARLLRVRRIAKWDRFDMGAWHQWRDRNPPLPARADQSDMGGAPRSIAMLAALATDHCRPFEERVAATAQFIADGVQDREAMVSVARYREGLLKSWNAGAIAIEATPDPRLVSVRASHPGALRLGYRWAPLVIAEGQVEGRRKITVAQFESGWADFGQLRKTLAALEPGWGGSATILGSPQGRPTDLPLDRLVAEVRSSMSSRAL